MSNILIVSEKPSIGKSIARAFKVKDSNESNASNSVSNCKAFHVCYYYNVKI